MSSTRAQQLEAVVFRAGQLALEYFGQLALEYFGQIGRLNVREKQPRDLVTDADLAVEKFLVEQLAAIVPGAGFYGEETGVTSNQAVRWVIDPIDGTHSFVRRQKYWSISVALEEEGVTTLACVFGPKLGDMYLAQKGCGATCNGEPIQSSDTTELSQSMVSTGFACLRAGLEENNLPRFNRIALQTMGQRRFGSAALDLCLVADGQVDAFWEMELNLYDIAAGALILQEAGGEVVDFSGRPVVNPKEILGTNQNITKEILALMF